MLNGLDLFSGIGGITLALAPWVRPIAYCENDRYAQSVLLSRQFCGQLPTAPIWDDVRTLSGSALLVPWGIDILYGGFPCQDISVAGRGKGLAGERSGLFWEITRLIGELQPYFIFLENVPAITSRGGAEVVGTFTEMGYDCRWCVIGADDVGAPHIRKRWFLLAHTNDRHHFQKEPIQTGWDASIVSSETVSNPNSQQYQNGAQTEWGQAVPQLLADTKGECKRESTTQTNTVTNCRHPWQIIGGRDWWTAEPGLDRMAYGIPNQVDRIRGLGNAVVPLQARKAFEILMGLTPNIT